MSFSSSRRRALNHNLPMGYRASHLRSCAMLIGQKWGVKRSNVLEVVQEKCGVDLSAIKTDHEIEIAIMILDKLRHNWLDA
jgi:hypothetical protein